MINILYLHAGAEMYGADKVLLDLIIRLDKNKYKPYVILPSNGILVNKLNEHNVDVMVLPYPIMRRKYFNIFGAFSYFFNLFKYVNIIKKFCIENDINIIHSNTAATVEGGIVAKILHLPHLWSIHEIIIKPKFMFALTSKLISLLSDVTITDSDAVKNHLLSSNCFNNSNIKTIYNGVDANRFKPNADTAYLKSEWKIPENVKIIGMVGRVNSWKGQNDFLKAAEIVMSKFDNVYSILVGSTFAGEEWRTEKLNDYISKSKFNDRIINVGYRNDSENIYNLFDIFILPSINPDPFPTVVLESMSCGKPIVGYSHGGVCEMVKNGYNGYLAKVRDIADLSDKIIKLLTDDKLRKEFGYNSRDRLLNVFSINKYVNSYSNIYDEMLNI